MADVIILYGFYPKSKAIKRRKIPASANVKIEHGVLIAIADELQTTKGYWFTTFEMAHTQALKKWKQYLKKAETDLNLVYARELRSKIHDAELFTEEAVYFRVHPSSS